MQTKEQLGAQFTWELKNIKKDLESFLEMSRGRTTQFRSDVVFPDPGHQCEAKAVQKNIRTGSPSEILSPQVVFVLRVFRSPIRIKRLCAC